MGPEGFIIVNGLRIFYRSEGEPRRGTVLGLHGGPGGTYDYLSPLFDLAGKGYRVVLYDQSGGGKSQRIKNPALYNIERYVEETEGVRRTLVLGKVHLFGHSWGGMLAQAYALKHQGKLASLILSGTTPSVPMLMAEGEKVFRSLPPDVREAVTKYEALGDFENPEYFAAIEKFNHTQRPGPLARDTEVLLRELQPTGRHDHVRPEPGRGQRQHEVLGRHRTPLLPEPPLPCDLRGQGLPHTPAPRTPP
ncbi:MAG: alpha/beta fold hydrolase [Nitrososphaerota archaeon]|nr:alpha/beta fold hydrolase [Nitrososphaerota archaeon]